jgi:tripartite-type tricarboxylate transporter receptor subunit TctC
MFLGGYVMKLPRRRFLHLAAGAAALPFAPRIARAQAYPTRSITMVVPFPPGGATDTIGRPIAERMRELLGQPVIVENVGGANGNIGTGRVARATPDGYTLLLGLWNTHVSNGALYTLPYDVVNDFEPIALLARLINMMFVRKSLPANNIRELIAWLKANSDKATQASAGTGSMGHLTGALFQQATGTRLQHVPYRGSAPALQDVVAGQIDVMVDAPFLVLPQMRAGRVKALAVLSKTRFTQAPEIPTMEEAGIAGFTPSNWWALWAPKGTPKDIITRLNAAVVKALGEAALQQKLAEQGFTVPPPYEMAPDFLASFQKAEIEKWWPIIKAAGIKGE